MGLWNYCEVCGERIETGQLCIGIKEESKNLCGSSMCMNCVEIENLPDDREPVSITDLLACAETSEERCKELEERCKRLNEARERANEAAAKWESAYKLALERAEKAEREKDAAVWCLREIGICGACSNTLCRERDGEQDCNFIFSGAIGRKEE